MFEEVIRPLTDQQIAELRDSAYLPMYTAWTELRTKLIAAHAEIVRLKAELRDRERRIGDASILMHDWDGEYNPDLYKGNAPGLASVIEESYTILQGKSWRTKNEQEQEQEQNSPQGAD
jgi:hypothetical protein